MHYVLINLKKLVSNEDILDKDSESVTREKITLVWKKKFFLIRRKTLFFSFFPQDWLSSIPDLAIKWDLFSFYFLLIKKNFFFFAWPQCVQQKIVCGYSSFDLFLFLLMSNRKLFRSLKDILEMTVTEITFFNKNDNYSLHLWNSLVTIRDSGGDNHRWWDLAIFY